MELYGHVAVFLKCRPSAVSPCGRYHTQSHSLSLEMVTVFHPPVYLCRGQTNSSLSTSPLHLSSALFLSTFLCICLALFLSTFPQLLWRLVSAPFLSISSALFLCSPSAFVVLCASTFAQHLLHFVPALFLSICRTLCQHFSFAFFAPLGTVPPALPLPTLFPFLSLPPGDSPVAYCCLPHRFLLWLRRQCPSLLLELVQRGSLESVPSCPS